MAVRGHSMEPALREGDWLFVLPPRRAPRVGDVVVARDPRDPSRLVVKRVGSVAGDAIVLEECARHPTDDGRYGVVTPADVIGRAAFRYAPLSRVGPVRA